MPLVHSVRRHQQHPGEAGQRDPPDQRPEGERADEEGDGVDEAGQARDATGLDADAHPRDRGGRRDPAEEGDDQIPQPLRDQLLIDQQLLADHPPGDGPGEQALDRAEGGDRDRRSEEIGQDGEIAARRDVAIGQHQGRGDRADRRDRPTEEPSQDRDQRDTEQGGGQPPAEAQARQEEHRCHHAEGAGDRVAVERGGRRGDIAEKFQGGQVRASGGDPERVIELSDRDHQRDPAGEAGDDRGGDEIDDPPEPEDPERQHDQPGHQRGEPEAVQAVLLHHQDQHRRHRPGGAADLIRRTAERADDQPGEDRGHQPGGGGRAAGDAEGQRQRQRHGGDCQPGDEIAIEEGARVATELAPPEVDQQRCAEAHRKALGCPLAATTISKGCPRQQPRGGR